MRWLAATMRSTPCSKQGWRPEDIALLTTGSRHPEQAQRQAVSQEDYWASFCDTEQVFYGHVLGFEGLERRAVVLVLVLNESNVSERDGAPSHSACGCKRLIPTRRKSR